MIAGGSEAAITPLGVGGFAAMRALSTRNEQPQRASRPFDKERDGFVAGEGSGLLILEELEHAKARGARIYCEVTGYSATADAYHITNPSGVGIANTGLNLTGNFSYPAGTNFFFGTVTSANGMSGSGAGRFYGPAAQEIGGVYNLSGTVGQMIGSFGGKQ